MGTTGIRGHNHPTFRFGQKVGTISTDAKLSNTTKTLGSCCNAVLTLMKSRTWPDKNGGLQCRPAHSRGVCSLQHILEFEEACCCWGSVLPQPAARVAAQDAQDRKSTRLNSSHRCSSYAVF